jgi:hypothetical protein
MANQQPSYQAYTVIKRENADPFWLNIGAAFMHQDGDGFNIVLQALPIDGKIVLRVPKQNGGEQVHETPKGDETAQAHRTIREENDRRRNRRGQ